MRIPFKQNMGVVDRVVRIWLGICFVFLGLFFELGPAGTVLLIFSILLLVTGTIGYCPLYVPFGFSSRRSKAESENDSSGSEKS